MLAVPVHALIETHVISDKDNLLRPELYREIESVEPGIPAPTQHAERTDKKSVLAALDLDEFDIPGLQFALLILGDLQALELGNAAEKVPPQEVACVENVSPRSELP